MSTVSRISIETILRVLVGLVGFFFLVLGIGFMAFPDVFAAGFSVKPAHSVGTGGIRADFGALFLGMSFFCLVGAASTARSLAVPITFLLVIIVGRILDIGLDGPLLPGGAFLSVAFFGVVDCDFHRDSC